MPKATHWIIQIDYYCCIASCWTKANGLGSWSNNRNYNENNARKAYQVNLYSIANHGSCRISISSMALWKPNFHKLCFIVCNNVGWFSYFGKN